MIAGRRGNGVGSATDVGTRIVQAIEDANTTRAEVARQLNVAPGAVSNWTKGRDIPSGENLLRLSRLLGKPVEFLLTGDAISVGQPVATSGVVVLEGIGIDGAAAERISVASGLLQSLGLSTVDVLVARVANHANAPVLPVNCVCVFEPATELNADPDTYYLVEARGYKRIARVLEHLGDRRLVFANPDFEDERHSAADVAVLGQLVTYTAYMRPPTTFAY